MSLVIAGTVRVPPEVLADFRPHMRAMLDASRGEDGCLEYSYAEDVLDPGLIRVSEVWASREQLAAHLKTPHMAVWAEERAGLGLTGRAITVYAVSGSETI